ncbi:hypothetical protein SCLCIDRAFT_1215198 [Scleroderma citrinum Foug A]|uniref:Uncharacterized protein n=1 Tax=Scleroderma citrinum Foug A TaxID=1036808 RepID=A0A0C3E2P6_9AGAM|nr:hypothetical protein SCLCIDRAFT_1215198 [Scleroderma citrinum Foug A]
MVAIGQAMEKASRGTVNRNFLSDAARHGSFRVQPLFEFCPIHSSSPSQNARPISTSGILPPPIGALRVAT